MNRSCHASLLVVLSVASAAILGSTAACSSSSEESDPCLVAAPVTETNAAEPCLGGTDVNSRLGLVRSFRRDTTMASNLARDVAAIPVDYFVGGFAKGLLLSFGVDVDTMPSHVVAQRFEAGTYAFDYDRTGALGSEAQTAQAHLRLYWPIDSKSAKKGDLITTSVLDKGAFLLNPRPSLRLDGTISIAHDGPGPLVEILGETASPPNPLVASASKLQAAFATIEVDGDAAMTIDNACNTSAFRFGVPRQAIAARSIQMLEGGGKRKANEDRADVRSWKLAYTSVAPTGTIAIEATAGAAPIADALTFAASSAEPASRVSCR